KTNDVWKGKAHATEKKTSSGNSSFQLNCKRTTQSRKGYSKQSICVNSRQLFLKVGGSLFNIRLRFKKDRRDVLTLYFYTILLKN
ncbi:hypothetical protein, partial [Bacteroides luti]|uniref:hypothetical protein n=1 Tax=Bacteroides luti TaxID=1297750 RepID=UPI001C31D053